MKKILFMAVAAIAALSSCSSDIDVTKPATGDKVVSFTATMEHTRVALDDYMRLTWQAEDVINVNGCMFKTDGNVSTDGSVRFLPLEGATLDGNPYCAYYPADIYDAQTETATLPAEVDYASGRFDMPMYAESTTTDLEFKNICAVLAVTLTRSDIATLKSIKVTSDKPMNGAFTVDEYYNAVGFNGTNEVVLKSETAITLPTEGQTFYIAIPAQEYKYLNIYLSADGETYTEAMATTKAEGLGKIARNTIYVINYAKNAVQMWANGPMFALYNVGVTDKQPKNFGGYYYWGGNIDMDPYLESNSGSEALTGDADTATKLWGSAWRMPTSTELQALIDNCNVSWTSNYKGTGVKGKVFTGKVASYNTNSIFLPATGFFNGGEGEVYQEGVCGYYWSSTPIDDASYFLQFSQNDQKLVNDYRDNGYSVRAVLK